MDISIVSLLLMSGSICLTTFPSIDSIWLVMIISLPSFRTIFNLSTAGLGYSNSPSSSINVDSLGANLLVGFSESRVLCPQVSISRSSIYTLSALLEASHLILSTVSELNIVSGTVTVTSYLVSLIILDPATQLSNIVKLLPPSLDTSSSKYSPFSIEFGTKEKVTSTVLKLLKSIGFVNMDEAMPELSRSLTEDNPELL